MAVKITREHTPGDRYIYDFGLCSAKYGFSQIDTHDDAWYYGNWANPFRRIIFSYTEGDCTLIECDTDAEFVAEIQSIIQWHKTMGGYAKIDALCVESAISRWSELGLTKHLH